MYYKCELQCEWFSTCGPVIVRSVTPTLAPDLRDLMISDEWVKFKISCWLTWKDNSIFFKFISLTQLLEKGKKLGLKHHVIKASFPVSYSRGHCWTSFWLFSQLHSSATAFSYEGRQRKLDRIPAVTGRKAAASWRSQQSITEQQWHGAFHDVHPEADTMDIV